MEAKIRGFVTLTSSDCALAGADNNSRVLELNRHHPHSYEVHRPETSQSPASGGIPAIIMLFSVVST